MSRYILALLLLSASYGKSAVIPESSTNGPLSKPLEELADSCKNTFLSSQIKGKLNECNLNIPPYNEKQFQCLIFYDINRQMCDAVSSLKLVLENDYTSKVNEEINVETLCVIARDWNFTSIENYPLYKDTVAKAFSIKISCMKICGNEEVTNLDTNFFCKYFKWGYDKLKQGTVPSPVVKTDVPMPNLPSAALANEKTVSLSAVEKVEKSVAAAATAVTAKQIQKDAQTQIVKSTAQNMEEPDNDEGKPAPQVTSTKTEDTANEVQSDSDVEVKIETPKKPDLALPNDERPNEPLDKPSAADIEKEDAQDKEEDTAEGVPSEGKDPTPVKSNKPADDDYQDSEEREGLPDGGDDADDPVIDNGDMKQYVTQPKAAQKTQTSLSFTGERKFYKNNLEDEFVDTDDHFFSFFVTAVILVVVLYVLYHNKSKVSKVFLGLIVEGRQPGRRRNSRGHAYRRLDTLEQAMSTNSAAPPSKIIY